MLNHTARHLRDGKAVAVFTSFKDAEIHTELLSEEERRRSERFTHTESRQAFLVGRTLIHKLLREFVDDVRIDLGPHGKPQCSDPLAPTFNLSHTVGGLLIVFSLKGPVGSDIEPLNRLPKNPKRLASKIFTERERHQLECGEKDFLTLWTRKEAVLKALGTGFAAGASQVETDDVLRCSGWKVEEFRLEGVQAAVCVPDSVSLILPDTRE